MPLSLSGFAFEADQSRGQSGQRGAGAQSSQSGGGHSSQATGQSDAYKVTVKKRDRISGADRQKCMDAAKKKRRGQT